MTLVSLQLGKNGLTKGFLETIQNHFKNYRIVKISVLKSYCRNKEELKKIVDKILDNLGKKYKAKAVGYVITIKKYRREVR